MTLLFLVKKSLILGSYLILRIQCGTLVLHFSGALDHGMHGNAFGDTESIYGKDTFEIPAAHTMLLIVYV